MPEFAERDLCEEDRGDADSRCHAHVNVMNVILKNSQQIRHLGAGRRRSLGVHDWASITQRHLWDQVQPACPPAGDV